MRVAVSFRPARKTSLSGRLGSDASHPPNPMPGTRRLLYSGEGTGTGYGGQKRRGGGWNGTR